MEHTNTFLAHFRGHGFDSRSGLNFFQALFLNCLSWVYTAMVFICLKLIHSVILRLVALFSNINFSIHALLVTKQIHVLFHCRDTCEMRNLFQWLYQTQGKEYHIYLCQMETTSLRPPWFHITQVEYYNTNTISFLCKLKTSLIPRAFLLLFLCFRSRSLLLKHCFHKLLFQKAFAAHFGFKLVYWFGLVTIDKESRLNTARFFFLQAIFIPAMWRHKTDSLLGYTIKDFGFEFFSISYKLVFDLVGRIFFSSFQSQFLKPICRFS